MVRYDVSSLEIAKYILSHIDNVREVINKVHLIKDDLIFLALSGEITEIDFYHITSLLTSQSRSPLWERFYIAKHSATKITARSNAGDFVLNETPYEYKASGFNVDNALHIVQVRLWQKCDYIVQSIQDNKVYTFRLTHAQMQEEVGMCGASSAHGTPEANRSNKNIEVRFTVIVGSDNWKRWIDRYLI